MDWIIDIHQPSVKELLWVIISPPLFDESKFTHFPLAPHSWWLAQASKNKDLFLKLNSQPELLEEWLNQAPDILPIGKRFEYLLKFFFSHAREITLLESGTQIFEQKTTIGELDFLIFDHSANQTIHLEVACKFYLKAPNSNQFIGPNGIDSLKEKIDKTKQQLLLTCHPNFTLQLPQFKNKSIIAKALFKGYLFYHFTTIPNIKTLPFVSKSHNASWFVYASELDDFIAEPGYWKILNKRDWLVPRPIEHSEIIDGKTLRSYTQNHFSKSKNALAVMQILYHDSCYKEISRGFIVHPLWPRI